MVGMVAGAAILAVGVLLGYLISQASRDAGRRDVSG